MHVVFTLFEGMTPLDLVGPFQIFAMAPDFEVTLAASTAGPKTTDSGMIIHADKALRDVDGADIIVVPGTSRPDLPLADQVLLDWLRTHAPRARWTTSVCSGALVLGAAGVLQGKRATTHWLALEGLRAYGAEPTSERVVFDGAVVTAAGVSAGIDMALSLLARVANPTVAQAVQLGIEYDPQPPFSAGSPKSAGPKIVEYATEMLLSAPGMEALRGMAPASS